MLAKRRVVGISEKAVKLIIGGKDILQKGQVINAKLPLRIYVYRMAIYRQIVLKKLVSLLNIVNKKKSKLQ